MDTTNKEKSFERISQADIPRATLRDAVVLAEALRDNFAGKGASGIDLAQAARRSPTSSVWRILTGAAVAYGLTDAGYNANAISLTTLGKQIVSPTYEGADKAGLMAAALRPSIPKAFYEKYDGAKLPKEDIAKNVLQGLGVPKDRTAEGFKIILDNAELIGAISRVGDGQFLQLRTATISTPINDTELDRSNGQLVPVNSGLTIKPPAQQHGQIPIEIIVPDELGLAISLSLHSKARRNKDLDTKVQALYDAADALAVELKKQVPAVTQLEPPNG